MRRLPCACDCDVKRKKVEAHMLHFVKWFFAEYAKLMRRQTPLEEAHDYSARTGYSTPNVLDLERDELEREVRRIGLWKRLRLIPDWKLFPQEQAAEHRKARGIALRWRDRANKSKQA